MDDSLLFIGFKIHTILPDYRTTWKRLIRKSVVERCTADGDSTRVSALPDRRNNGGTSWNQLLRLEKTLAHATHGPSALKLFLSFFKLDGEASVRRRRKIRYSFEASSPFDFSSFPKRIIVKPTYFDEPNIAQSPFCSLYEDCSWRNAFFSELILG